MNQKPFRFLLSASITCLSIQGLFAENDSDKPPRVIRLAQATTSKTSDTKISEEQESQAIRFVEANHPELANLLVVLKSMNQDKYESAIRDVTKALKRLDATQKRDAQLYAIEVEGWKIQSRIDLLLAKGVAKEKDGGIDKTALKALLHDRVENKKSLIQRELEVIEARAASYKESLEKLQKEADDIVERQQTALLKKVKNNKLEKTKDDKASDR